MPSMLKKLLLVISQLARELRFPEKVASKPPFKNHWDIARISIIFQLGRMVDSGDLYEYLVFNFLAIIRAEEGHRFGCCIHVHRTSEHISRHFIHKGAASW